MRTRNPKYFTDGRFDIDEYRRVYLAEHPDKQRQWRLNAARRLLERNGFTVIAPDANEGSAI